MNFEPKIRRENTSIQRRHHVNFQDNFRDLVGKSRVASMRNKSPLPILTVFSYAKKFIEIPLSNTYIADITIKIADEKWILNPLDPDVKIAFKITMVVPTQRKVSQCRCAGIRTCIEEDSVYLCSNNDRRARLHFLQAISITNTVHV